MDWIEALILGLLQGLTEFLPVSSSGHLEIGKHLMGVEVKDNLIFTIVVHGATVLSTIVVFWKDIVKLFKGLFLFELNDETKYVIKIIVSMIPIGIVGVFFKDKVEALFSAGNIMLIVGCMLLLTSILLAFTYFAKQKSKDISYGNAFVIGIAQTLAVMPGLSRSGSTIATGLLLGNRKAEVAKFSFLMVLVPILGENVLSLFKGDVVSNGSIELFPLVIGFIAAFVSGLLACKWMVELVKRGKLIYFAVYCALVGILVVVL